MRLHIHIKHHPSITSYLGVVHKGPVRRDEVAPRVRCLRGQQQIHLFFECVCCGVLVGGMGGGRNACVREGKEERSCCRPPYPSFPPFPSPHHYSITKPTHLDITPAGLRGKGERRGGGASGQGQVPTQARAGVVLAVDAVLEGGVGGWCVCLRWGGGEQGTRRVSTHMHVANHRTHPCCSPSAPPMKGEEEGGTQSLGIGRKICLPPSISGTCKNGEEEGGFQSAGGGRKSCLSPSSGPFRKGEDEGGCQSLGARRSSCARARGRLCA